MIGDCGKLPLANALLDTARLTPSNFINSLQTARSTIP
jgi:hypothetical protein